MTAPGGKRTYQGFRHVQILALDSNGYPNATATTYYDGAALEAVNSLAVNSPEARLAVHRGDDRVYQTATLPPTDPLSAVLTGSKMNNTIDAILGDDLDFTVGDIRMMGMGTNTQGEENEVAVLAFAPGQEAGDIANDGKARWEFILFPLAVMFRREPGFAGDALNLEKVYDVHPRYRTQHLWGVSFATATEGFKRAQGLRGITDDKPHIVGFLGDGATTAFVFPTNPAPNGTAKMVAWDNGTLQVYTTNYTASTVGIWFVTAPVASNQVVVWYEYA
jgi:hypothetical protein